VLLVEDAARVGRISAVQRCWAPAGLRPRVPNRIIRESLSAVAAVDPASGAMSCLIVPRANNAMMNVFLTQVAEDCSDSFVVIQVDGAPWHTSPNLQVPENIRVITQPADSPERNPVAHRWDDIREQKFPNAVHETLDQVQAAVSTGVRRLVATPEKLASMTCFPHLRAAWRQFAWSWACVACFLQR